MKKGSIGETKSEQRKFGLWLKLIITASGILGGIILFRIIPGFGKMFVRDYEPMMSQLYRPWTILIWVSSIPFFGSLIPAWLVASHIGRGNAFSYSNSKNVRIISWMAFCAGMIFFSGNLIYCFWGWNHPGVALMSLIPEGLCLAISGACAVLSKLIWQAAELKEQNDLTI